MKQNLIISHLSKITTNILFYPVLHVGAAIWIKKCKWMQSNFCAGIGWLPHVSAFPLFPRLLTDLKPWRTRRGFYPVYLWIYSTSQLTLQSTYLSATMITLYENKVPLPTLPQMCIHHLILLCKSSGFCLQSPGKGRHRNKQTLNSIQFTGVFINWLDNGNAAPQIPPQPSAEH